MKYPLLETDLSESQRLAWWGRDTYFDSIPSGRRDELLSRLEAASRVVFGDRRLLTLPSHKRYRIAVCAMKVAMSDGKLKPYSRRAEFEADYDEKSEIAQRILSVEREAIAAAEAAHAAPQEA